MWPGFDSWFSWAVLMGVIAATATILFGSWPLSLRRIVAGVIVGLMGWYSAALFEESRTAPERAYAYLFVHPNRTELHGDTVELFRRSTGILDKVKICFVLTNERQTATRYPCVPNQENGVFHTFGEGEEPFVRMPLGDWTFDIDPPSKLGKVLQRLNIVQENGHAVTVFAQARRKEGNREVLCETPRRGNIPLCL